MGESNQQQMDLVFQELKKIDLLFLELKQVEGRLASRLESRMDALERRLENIEIEQMRTSQSLNLISRRLLSPTERSEVEREVRREVQRKKQPSVDHLMHPSTP